VVRIILGLVVHLDSPRRTTDISHHDPTVLLFLQHCPTACHHNIETFFTERIDPDRSGRLHPSNHSQEMKASDFSEVGSNSAEGDTVFTHITRDLPHPQTAKADGTTRWFP
jgi:hypothetical protein